MKKIMVEIPIKTTMEKLWHHSKDLKEHVKWDLRFTQIREKSMEETDDENTIASSKAYDLASNETSNEEPTTQFTYETKLGPEIHPRFLFLLWLVYLICTIALSFVWMWEGLVPKILFPSDEEIAMVEQTGLAWWDAASFIPFLGFWEILLGALLLLGIYRKLLALLSLALLLFFTFVLPFYSPELLYHPYGALTKNFGLIACSLVIILLDHYVPKASRCKREGVIFWQSWLLHILLAVGGSAIYGASLSLLFPRWTPVTGALWLILSAGIAWLFLWIGIYLSEKGRINPVQFIQFSLITMRYGIFVLIVTSFINLGIYRYFTFNIEWKMTINLTMILLSNLFMAHVFVRFMNTYAVPTWRAIRIWILWLVGSGALLFYFIERVLP